MFTGSRAGTPAIHVPLHHPAAHLAAQFFFQPLQFDPLLRSQPVPDVHLHQDGVSYHFRACLGNLIHQPERLLPVHVHLIGDLLKVQQEFLQTGFAIHQFFPVLHKHGVDLLDLRRGELQFGDHPLVLPPLAGQIQQIQPLHVRSLGCQGQAQGRPKDRQHHAGRHVAGTYRHGYLQMITL